jgi:cytoskeletal protein RodZ
MGEIGEALRERRMAMKIDVHEVEEETKIRAKYLRALENEEYNLLPGPAYVKSFLRTYADYLNLDSRTLVDRYKTDHERFEDEHALFAVRSERASDRAPRRGLRIAVIAIAAVLLVLIVLAVIGATGGRS